MLLNYFAVALTGTYIVLFIEICIFLFFIWADISNNPKLPFIKRKWRIIISSEILFNIIFVIGFLLFSNWLDKKLDEKYSVEIYKALSKIVITIGSIAISVGQIWLTFFKSGIKFSASSQHEFD